MTPQTPRPRSGRDAAARLAPDAGVTLVEMLVVVVIIGLITAIVAINVVPALDNGRITKARADISQLNGALTQFYSAYGRYPTVEEGLEALVTPPRATDGATPALVSASFVNALPQDPWGRPYRYIVPGGETAPGQSPRPFDLYSLGADGREGGTGANADIVHWRQ